MNFFWKPMPYYWIREGKILKEFKRNNLSAAIAALKIYILIVLTSSKDSDGGYSSSITYDQITKMASISRALVSSGLKKLFELELIETEGVRRKKYFLLGVKTIRNDSEKPRYIKVRFHSEQGFWAKTPHIGMVDESGRIAAFEAMTNRSVLDLNSLRLFIYFLSIKSKGEVSISVSTSKIRNNTGISYSDIFAAIGFMQSIGMLYRVSFGGNTIIDHDPSSIIHFLVCGWECLEWKPHYLSEEEWQDRFTNPIFSGLEIPNRLVK